MSAIRNLYARTREFDECPSVLECIRTPRFDCSVLTLEFGCSRVRTPELNVRARDVGVKALWFDVDTSAFGASYIGWNSVVTRGLWPGVATSDVDCTLGCSCVETLGASLVVFDIHWACQSQWRSLG